MKHVLPRTLTGGSRFGGLPLFRILFRNPFRNHDGPRMVCRRAAGCLFKGRVEGRAGFGVMRRCGWRGGWRFGGGFARGLWNRRAGNGGRCVFRGLRRRDGFDFGFDRVFVLFGRELAAKF